MEFTKMQPREMRELVISTTTSQQHRQVRQVPIDGYWFSGSPKTLPQPAIAKMRRNRQQV